jgi:uncharacterized membrane protein YcgQ (UPF0703/DUF1980 family)
MPNRVTIRNVRAKELSSALRRRFHLVTDEEVSVTVTRASARKAPPQNDPWLEIRGTLSAIEADEMIRAIHASRRNKSDAPELDAP